MRTIAEGPFAVQLVAQPAAAGEPALPARHALAKQFTGDLEATGAGVMLSFGSPASGSAAYSALEVVTGSLHGKSGSFALQHTGVIDRGSPSLSIRVVPDSGTGELVGLAGTLDIRIVDGKHFYAFDYTLDGAI